MLPADQSFDGVTFEFTNKSIVSLKGKCIIFYADKKNQLRRDKFLRKLDLQTKRKLLEYFDYADNELLQSKESHCLVPIDIARLQFSYLMMVKLEPWDGESKTKMKDEIEKLTDRALEVLKEKNIE